MAEKVSKVSVHYRNGTARECCGNCSMFQVSKTARNGECTLVRGTIMPNKVCDRWAADATASS